MKVLLDAKGFARALSISESYVWQLVAQRRIASVKIGRCRRFDADGSTARRTRFCGRCWLGCCGSTSANVP